MSLTSTSLSMVSWPNHYIYALLLGLVMGSFLNVCIWRLPRHESLLTPSSHCPSCGKPIAIYNNIPVVSFLLLRGRCRSCRQPISWRYPMVELANGLSYVMLLWRYGLGWPTAVSAAIDRVCKMTVDEKKVEATRCQRSR